MKTKKKLAVFLTLVMAITVCCAISGYVWASSTSSESYMATDVKKVHTNSPIIWVANGYNATGVDGKLISAGRCNTCGAWLETCAQHDIEFNGTSNYSVVDAKNTINGSPVLASWPYMLHSEYHTIYNDGGFANGDGSGSATKSTKIYLKQDLYEVTGIAPVK